MHWVFDQITLWCLFVDWIGNKHDEKCGTRENKMCNNDRRECIGYMGTSTSVQRGFCQTSKKWWNDFTLIHICMIKNDFRMKYLIMKWFLFVIL